jgi:O-antigen/teichoic acid export membrane protein
MTDTVAIDARTPPTGASRGTLGRDIASACLVTAARVGAWAMISALVFRRLGRDAFAMLALIRSTVGLLAYTSVGLAPAMVRALAAAGSGRSAVAKTPRDDGEYAVRDIYASGAALATFSALLGALVCLPYALFTNRLHSVPKPLIHPVTLMASFFGFAMVLRLLSEPPASLLQVRGRIALDNLLLTIAELIWVAGSLVLVLTAGMGLVGVGATFFAGNLFVLVGRWAGARRADGDLSSRGARANLKDMRRLLLFGIGVAVAQAADFLYAPTDYILINWLIGTGTVAVYAPAVQIDGGLLLIVTGLAAVLLPHSALAHAAGDRPAVRRYYVRGTLASIALLTPAALAVWFTAPWLLRLWLGTSMPQTLEILPIVLVNTIIGGSGAVGRSVLLAMGKVRAFSASVVTAGFVNLILSFVFVRFLHLGLIGIILGTIVAVVGRCAVWMPWYLHRCLKKTESERSNGRNSQDE